MSDDWCQSTEEQPDEPYEPEVIVVQDTVEDK